ncbi:Constituent of 66S pre-ribosomal particles [Blumeria graminis f. sp. tritici 96224]|uniref:Bgt-1972 n=1 Tax=Blumeria graminis f. sp. tritici 96224 TaxID=1268274 RepID=A0A061HIH5_BLUGR|nr:Constituent of 66S pre-ribosomal particles [Blumeria graminis f. sp. tritici 96224]
MVKRKPSSSHVPLVRDVMNDSEFPKLNDMAFSALTTKIEQNLEKQKSEQSQKDRLKILPSNRELKNETLKKKMKNKKTKRDARQPELTKATKRGLEDCTKSPGKRQKSEQSQVEIEELDSKDILLNEIIALGGTHEDLELVRNVISDDEGMVTEPANQSHVDKSFNKVLAKFVAGLEIQQYYDEPENDTPKNEPEDEERENNTISYSLNKDPKSIRNSNPSISARDVPKNDHNRLIFEARPDWHTAPLPTLPSSIAQDMTIHTDSISSLKKYADSLLEAENQLYTSKNLSSSSSHRFLSTIMTSGTLSDKISALTLVIQESPVHTTKSFESLIALAKKRSRGQAVTALAALKDLLGTGAVLPSDRRLRKFDCQPGLLSTLSKHCRSSWKAGQNLPGDISKAHLISWAYEDWLKQSYFEILKILENWCNDEVEYARSRVVTYIYELLKDKPEQEANLLRLLVNKLGDPNKKISSRASYLILQLQIYHPFMKPIIIRSIETELLLRPGQSMHARYYAINTLNQTILSAKEENVAKELLKIYFEQFVTALMKPDIQMSSTVPAPVVNRKGQVQGGGGQMGKKAKAKLAKEMDSNLASESKEKMISAILTGVNRAFPFSKSDSVLDSHMDTLFRITHSSNFNTSIQALVLIQQLATKKSLSLDRFYRTLYESLLDPRLINSSKHAMYLNLLYKSLQADTDIKRVKAFAKRMMQVITLHQPSFICGILFLLKEIETNFPGIKSLCTDPEDDDNGEESYHDVADERNITQQDQKSSATKNNDGKKRDPQYSFAENSCLWEIIPFISHFHPSVSLFASSLLYDGKAPPKPQLASHTLSSFLDRFVYRNAKSASSGPKGSSIMQPLAGSENNALLISSKLDNHAQLPLNHDAFWQKKIEDVAVDEVFFHKYFRQIGKHKQPNNKKTRKDMVVDNSDGDEDQIWQALVKSQPDMEGIESDVDMSEIDESDDQGSSSELELGDNLEDSSESESIYDEKQAVSSDADSVEMNGLFNQELKAGAQEAIKSSSRNSKTKRKMMKNLPTFASMEEYAEVLDDDDENDEDFGES